MNPFNRNAALWIVIVLLLALLYSVFQGGATILAAKGADPRWLKEAAWLRLEDLLQALHQRGGLGLRIAVESGMGVIAGGTPRRFIGMQADQVRQPEGV